MSTFYLINFKITVEIVVQILISRQRSVENHLMCWWFLFFSHTLSIFFFFSMDIIWKSMTKRNYSVCHRKNFRNCRPILSNFFLCSFHLPTQSHSQFIQFQFWHNFFFLLSHFSHFQLKLLFFHSLYHPNLKTC